MLSSFECGCWVEKLPPGGSWHPMVHWPSLCWSWPEWSLSTSDYWQPAALPVSGPGWPFVGLKHLKKSITLGSLLLEGSPVRDAVCFFTRCYSESSAVPPPGWRDQMAIPNPFLFGGIIQVPGVCLSLSGLSFPSSSFRASGIWLMSCMGHQQCHRGVRRSQTPFQVMPAQLQPWCFLDVIWR